MELSQREKAVLDEYLKAARGSGIPWKIILFLGGIICVTSLIMLAVTDVALCSALLFLVTGLVAVARALDQRNRALVGQIIHRYNTALEELKAEMAQNR